MASLWNHPKSKYWFACFTDRHGKRRKVSTKTTDKRAALRIALDFEAAFRQVQTMEQFEKVMRRAREDFTGEKIHSVSVEEYLGRWLAQKEASKVSASSLRTYTLCAKRLLESLGAAAKKPILSVTKKQLEDCREDFARNVATRTVQMQCRIIRMIFKSAKEDYGGESPAEFLRSPGTTRASEKFKKAAFTADQLRQLLGSLSGELKTLTVLGAYTGARLGDMQHLQWGSVDLKARVISFRAQKTGRMMRVPIAPPLEKLLSSLESREGYVVPGLAAKPTNSVSVAFVAALRKIGLREGKGSGGLSFHSLRHGLVSLLKEAGASASVAMEFAGHDSAKMSEHYTTVSDKAMQEAADGLPDLL